MTAPHIGNTGVNDEDPESRPDLGRRATSCATRPGVPSNWRSQRSLDDELRAQGVVGISGIDTRALTRHLRERGAMRVGISSDRDRRRRAARAGAGGAGDGRRRPGRRGVAPPSRTSCRRSGEKRFTVAALDLGIKAMTPQRMAERGIEVHVLPATATLDDVLAIEPDGVFFSNGPGDPATADARGRAAARRCSSAGMPYFGICFGNQLFGRALGFGTYKLKYGHRGINQPVDGPHHRQGRGHRAQPRLRGRRAARRRRPRRRTAARDGEPRLPQRRRGRGARAASTTTGG